MLGCGFFDAGDRTGRVSLQWPGVHFCIACCSWLERLFLACYLPVTPLFLSLSSSLLPPLRGRPRLVLLPIGLTTERKLGQQQCKRLHPRPRRVIWACLSDLFRTCPSPVPDLLALPAPALTPATRFAGTRPLPILGEGE